MKLLRTLLIFLSLLTGSLAGSGTLKAQLYGGIGYQQGFWHLPASHVAVDRLNDSGYLVRPMRQLRWPGGEIFAVSYRPQRLLAELSLNTRRQRVSAVNYTGGEPYRLDVRFSMQFLSLGLGYAVHDADKEQIYLGASLDGGYMRLLSRQGQENAIGNSRFSLYRQQGTLALSGFARFGFRADREALTLVTLSLYGQFVLSTFDFTVMNQLLNPYTWNEDPSPLSGRPSNVGISLQVDLDLVRALLE